MDAKDNRFYRETERERIARMVEEFDPAIPPEVPGVHPSVAVRAAFYARDQIADLVRRGGGASAPRVPATAPPMIFDAEGHHFLVSELSRAPTVAFWALREGCWYCLDEEGPVTPQDMHARSWRYGSPVKYSDAAVDLLMSVAALGRGATVLAFSGGNQRHGPRGVSALMAGAEYAAVWDGERMTVVKEPDSWGEGPSARARGGR